MMKNPCRSLLVGFCLLVAQSAIANLSLQSCGVSSPDAAVESCADTYFVSVQPPVVIGPRVLFSGKLGGIAAPLTYYPDAKRKITDAGLDLLKGDGTFEIPHQGSALGYRRVLYAGLGDPEVLEAFYTDAIREFTPQLGALLVAEEQFRTALRLDPFYEDALRGFLEVYYARAEGFMLIGNHYMAKAYRHKFDRSPLEDQSVVALEIADIDNALSSYEVGYREFMKLFNPNFIGVGGYEKPHLNIDPEWLFFEPRYPHPDDPSRYVGYEALRGQNTALGINTRLLDADGDEILPVQGSPSLAFKSSQAGQIAALDVPVKFIVPTIESLDPNSIKMRFDMDIADGVAVSAVELLIEFDHDKLKAPDSAADFDFTSSHFKPVRESLKLFNLGDTFQEKRLFANQVLLVFETEEPVTGIGRRVVSVPFSIRGGVLEEVNAYVAGSGGSLLSGFKDMAILTRLAAAHVNATKEKVRRLYNVASPDDSLAVIEEEVDRISGWDDHIQALLERAATRTDIENNERLLNAQASLDSESNGISTLGGFIRSGANVFGYPDDYLPFYNGDTTDTFTAIRNLVVGSGAFTPNSAQGHFGTARDAETSAIQNYDKLLNTKDRIRNELFTINEQAENRLLRICGRIDEATGEPSLDPNDPIDVDMRASPGNIASDFGQQVSHFEIAQKQLERANQDIVQFLADIELEKQAFQDELHLHESKTQVIAEFSESQQKINKLLSDVQVEQTRLNAVALATTTMTKSGSWDKFITGGVYSAAATATIQLLTGFRQARLEEKKGDLAVEKTRLASAERIRLTEIDTEIFKLQRMKNIEQMVNDIVVKSISAQIEEINVVVALGQMNQLIVERDALLARRGRALANLGEMSFADPSFRLTQFQVMKEAEIQLEFLKKWLYLMTRSVYYEWALPEDYVLSGGGFLSDISIDDIKRLQVVGATSDDSASPLADNMTAADYVQALLAFHEAGPIRLNPSPVSINRVNSNNSARYSLREDFLRIVREADTAAENARVRAAFQAWLTSPERLDPDGNLVIEFDTMGHLENYNLPIDEVHNTWTHFALRSFSTKPLWNHKIAQVGVALKAQGLAFKPGSSSVAGALEYGGTGYLKEDSDLCSDFRAYPMRQWRDRGNGELEPIQFRTVALTIPTSSTLEATEQVYLVSNLKERPVASTRWRLFIPESQVHNIEMSNIEDVYIYIYSEAYQRQSNATTTCLDD